jgi:hypothetical protein
MKIEKYSDEELIYTNGYGIRCINDDKQKLNLIIDKLDLESEHIDAISVLLNNVRDRMGKFIQNINERLIILEQCPVNDIRQCNIQNLNMILMM